MGGYSPAMINPQGGGASAFQANGLPQQQGYGAVPNYGFLGGAPQVSPMSGLYAGQNYSTYGGSSEYPESGSGFFQPTSLGYQQAPESGATSIGGGYNVENPVSSGLTENYLNYLNSQIGGGMSPYGSSTMLPTGQTSGAGALSSPISDNSLLSSLLGFYQTGQTNVPGMNTLGSYSGGSGLYGAGSPGYDTLNSYAGGSGLYGPNSYGYGTLQNIAGGGQLYGPNSAGYGTLSNYAAGQGLPGPNMPGFTDLQNFANGQYMPNATNTPGYSTLQSYLANGNPINTLPEWNSMVAAQQQGIQQNLAQLQGASALSGTLNSTTQGSALSNYESQTTANQNALLGQLTTQALQQAQSNQLGAANSLNALQMQGLGMQQSAGQDLSGLYQQGQGMQMNAAQQLQSNLAASQQQQQAAAGELGQFQQAGQQQQLGAASTLGGMYQNSQQQQLGAANTLEGLYGQSGQYVQGLNNQAIQNQYQQYLQTAPQYNPTLGAQGSAAFSYPPLYNTTGQGLGTTGAVLSSLPGIIGALGGNQGLINSLQNLFNGGTSSSQSPSYTYPGYNPGPGGLTANPPSNQGTITNVPGGVGGLGMPPYSGPPPTEVPGAGLDTPSGISPVDSSTGYGAYGAGSSDLSGLGSLGSSGINTSDLGGAADFNIPGFDTTQLGDTDLGSGVAEGQFGGDASSSGGLGSDLSNLLYGTGGASIAAGLGLGAGIPLAVLQLMGINPFSGAPGQQTVNQIGASNTANANQFEGDITGLTSQIQQQDPTGAAITDIQPGSDYGTQQPFYTGNPGDLSLLQNYYNNAAGSLNQNTPNQYGQSPSGYNAASATSTLDSDTLAALAAMGMDPSMAQSTLGQWGTDFGTSGYYSQPLV